MILKMPRPHFIAACSIFFCATMPTISHAQSPSTLPLSGLRTGANEVVSLSIEEAVALALERSYKMARSNRNRQISEFRTDIAGSALMPRVSMGINADQSARAYTYDSDKFLDFEQQISGEFRASVNLNVTLPLDISRTINRQIQYARTSQDLATIENAITGLDVSIETVNNYAKALKAQNALEADLLLVNLIEDLLDKARGKTNDIVPFLELELANAQGAASLARTSFDAAQDDLRQILRVPAQTNLRLTTNFMGQSRPADKADLVLRALENRPEIRHADLKIGQSEIAAKQVGDNLRPSASVSGFYNDQMSSRSFYDGSQNRFTNAGIGVNLSVPLLRYDGGALSRQRQIANFGVAQSRADADEIREKITYEVRRAALAVERAGALLTTLPDSTQALAVLQMAENEMLGAPPNEAQNHLAQITNARRAWRTAETASSDAYIDYNLAIYRLRRTIGESPIQ